MSNWYTWWTTDWKQAHLRNKREPRAVCGERLGSKARPADTVTKCAMCRVAEAKLKAAA